MWDILTAAVSAACSFISSCASTIGGAIATAATTLAPYISKALEVVSTIVDIAKALGIIGNETDPKELGYQATHSDKSPEDFQSYKDYMKHIQSIEVDKEKLENASDTEKLAYLSIGSAVALKGIAENKGVESIDPHIMVSVSKFGGSPESQNLALDKHLEVFKNGSDTDRLAGYIDGNLESAKDKIFISDRLNDIYKELNPEMSEKEICQKVVNMEGSN